MSDDSVERYLDEMFDGLAGTGAAGRRALAETEDHLRSSVADAMAAGLPAHEAEREAIARFGAPTRIAAQIRRANRASLAAVLLSAGWLLAALVGLVLAGTFLVKAVEIAILLRLHPEAMPACPGSDWAPDVPPGTVVSIGPCSTTVVAMWENVVTGLVMLGVAVGVLLIRRIAVQRAQLPITPQRFPLLAAALFAVAALVVAYVLNPMTPLGSRVFPHTFLGVQQAVGLWHQVVAGALALLTSIASVTWYLVGRSRAAAGSRHPVSPPSVSSRA